MLSIWADGPLAQPSGTGLKTSERSTRARSARSASGSDVRIGPRSTCDGHAHIPWVWLRSSILCRAVLVSRAWLESQNGDSAKRVEIRVKGRFTGHEQRWASQSIAPSYVENTMYHGSEYIPSYVDRVSSSQVSAAETPSMKASWTADTGLHYRALRSYMLGSTPAI